MEVVCLGYAEILYTKFPSHSIPYATFEGCYCCCSHGNRDFYLKKLKGMEKLDKNYY